MFDETRSQRMKRSARAAVLAGATAILSVLVSYSAAGAVTSYHGSDYTYDYNFKLRIKACDQEADSNHVKGGYAFYSGGGEVGYVEDVDGFNTICATGSSATEYYRHHTCERNLFAWDCDNWQVT
jgi:hypothetical protein